MNAKLSKLENYGISRLHGEVVSAVNEAIAKAAYEYQLVTGNDDYRIKDETRDDLLESMIMEIWKVFPELTGGARRAHIDQLNKLEKESK